MESLRAEVDKKRELDDSGCVQDETPPFKKLLIDDNLYQEMDIAQQFQLLDFSDDVLLCILKYCSPMDLKALGFTCSRLGRLILDRTLWHHVDMRSHGTGLSRMRWFLTHGLQADTVQLSVKGFAGDNVGCKGLAYGKRAKVKNNEEISPENNRPPSNHNGEVPARRPIQFHVNAVPHVFMTSPAEDDSATPVGDCPGPQYTLTNCVLAQLSAQCPSLHTLCLEYCHFGSDVTGISTFPPTLKKLSMRGSKYQYQFRTRPRQSSLFQINYCLPNLEYLDLSECDWLDAASLLPLSKLSNLTHLYMRKCMQLNEFTAYASLATRYGFLKLKVLDLRGSPVGDSEVSALGWLPALRELRVAPPARPEGGTHSHYEDDEMVPFKELSEWEEKTPKYFGTKDRLSEDNPNCIHRCNYSQCPSRSKRNEVKTPKFKDPYKNKHEDNTQPGSDDNDDDDDDKPKRNGAPITDELSDDVINRVNKRAYENGGGDCPIIIAGPSKRIRPDPALEELKQDGCWTKHIGGISIHKLPARSDGASTSSSNNSTLETNDENIETNANNSHDTNTQNTQDTKTSNTNDENDAENDTNDDSDSNKVKIKIVDASKSDSDSEEESTSTRKVTSANPNNYIRFRRNQPPIAVGDNNANGNDEFNNFINRNRPAGPRHRILYVDFDLPNQMDVAVHARRFNQNVFYTMPLDFNSLVSDNAIRRFGNSDAGGNCFIQVLPPYNARPNRSRLRILSATGYRNITDASLEHLATSAPDLVSIDFSGTRVTAEGVERFRALRPDVEVIFGNDERRNEMNSEERE